jgi:hypothetical protein
MQYAPGYRILHYHYPPPPERKNTMSELMQIIIQRDGLTREEAAQAIAYARHLVHNEGCDPEEVLIDEFGLEPDYIFDLI